MKEFEGCFLRMEKIHSTAIANPMLIAADARSPSGLMMIDGLMREEMEVGSFCVLFATQEREG